MTDKEIEQRLTLLAAKQPRTEEGQLMLQAAQAINNLRAKVKYEQARADFHEPET